MSLLNKINYICSSISENMPVEIISTSMNSSLGYFKGRTEIIDKNIILKQFSAYKWGNIFQKVLAKFHYVFTLFFYLIFHVGRNEKIIVYHSVSYINIIKLAKSIKHFRLILEIEEIYGDVSGSSKIIDKELKYFKYKYVIIDEYQDTSFSKYLLIKKLYDKFNLYLTAVGDDFQSIYSFTGCDLNIFFNFKKNFLNSKIIKLKNTYRCPSDVVNVSSRFVMKNKRQMRKSLHSFRRLKNSIIIVFSKNIISDFIHILEKHNDILVLGRNNKDVLLLIDNDNFTLDNNKIIYTKNESKNITFLTVHSSKGLEGENVVILNVVDDYLGFPNKIEENDLLNYLCTKKKENVLYGEERRLFYVALTRTRNYVYIFTNRFNKSIFVNELLTSYRWKIKIMEFEV